MSTSTGPTDELQVGRSIEVAGISTHLHEAGEGQAVLLLHGSGPGVSAWANWRLVLPALSRRFRVIAPDQLGFGLTGPPADGVYGRAAWTQHALELVDALGIERFSVIGNSMGGAIALSIAEQRPEAVDRLVVMGTTGIRFQLPRGLDEVWGYEPSRESMRALIELFAYDDSIATDDLVDLRYEQSRRPGAQETFAAMFPAPRQRWLDDLALEDDALRRITQPTLLVHGYEDEIIPFADSTLRMMDRLPNAEMHVFGRCGHWVQIEHTARFNQVVGDFLAAE